MIEFKLISLFYHYLNKSCLNHYFRASLPSEVNYCHYMSITRNLSAEIPDNTLIYSKPVIFWSAKQQNTHKYKLPNTDTPDTLLIECVDKHGQAHYTNAHMNIHLKTELEEELKKMHTNHLVTFKPKEQLNVVMLMLESLSSQNMIRQMPWTRHYMLHNMKAIELKGHHRNGMNTMPNFLSMLTGQVWVRVNKLNKY